jgi:hypothetical protein
MKTKALEDLENLMERIETWPVEAQEELMQAVLEIETRYSTGAAGQPAPRDAAKPDPGVDAFGWTGRRERSTG